MLYPTSLVIPVICPKFVILNSPKHAGPEAKCSNPTAGLNLLRARNQSRGNINHWQVSRKEALVCTSQKTRPLSITPFTQTCAGLHVQCVIFVTLWPKSARVSKRKQGYKTTGYLHIEKKKTQCFVRTDGGTDKYGRQT